jgi:hypothetical protein
MNIIFQLLDLFLPDFRILKVQERGNPPGVCAKISMNFVFLLKV